MTKRFKPTQLISHVAIITGLLGGAFSAQAESLNDALTAAYTSNPSLLGERARLRATDEGANQARAGWRPTVTINGSYSNQVNQIQGQRFVGDTAVSTVSATHQESFAGQLVITQPLFNGLQTMNAKRGADARVRAGRAQLWSTEQTVLLDTVTAYSDVIRDEATVSLNKNNVQVLTRQLEASQDRFRVGEITRTDVAQSEARLSLSKSNLTRSEAALAESRSRYAVLVGQAPGTLDPLPELPALPTSLDEAISGAIANNPTLVGAKENEQAAKFDVAQSKGGLLPAVQMQGTFNTSERTDINHDQSASGRFVTQLSIPLYQGGAQYSRIRQAKHNHSQTRLQTAQAQRQAQQLATNSWENLMAARATIVSDREQVRANEIAFDGVRQEAQVGSRTTLDVLDAEQELLDAKVALVRAERDEYVAAFQLLAATGNLTAENLGLEVELYDPVKNYKDVRNKLIGYGTND